MEQSPLLPCAVLRGTSSASQRGSPSRNREGFCAAPERDLSQACASSPPNLVAPEVLLEEFQAIRLLGKTDCPDNPGPRPMLKRKGTPAFQIRRLVQQDTWGTFHPGMKTVSGRIHKNLSRGLAWANRLCLDPRTQSRAGSATDGSPRLQAGAELVLLHEPRHAQSRHRRVRAMPGGESPWRDRPVRCAK